MIIIYSEISNNLIYTKVGITYDYIKLYGKTLIISSNYDVHFLKKKCA